MDSGLPASQPFLSKHGRTKRFLLVLKANWRWVSVPPLLFLVLVCALCIFAVVHSTSHKVASERDFSKKAAEATADSLKLQLNVVAGTLRTMASFVAVQPDWNLLLSKLPNTAAVVADQVACRSELQISGLIYMPFGVISAFFPEDSPLTGLGTDTFSPRFRERLGILDAVRDKAVTFNGPRSLSPEFPNAILARYSLFISDSHENESWNNPWNMTGPSWCPPGICYNETTREKFWGFVGTYVLATPLFSGEISQFNTLRRNNYGYRLTRSGIGVSPEESIVVEQGMHNFEASATIDVGLPGANWRFEVYNPEIKHHQDMAKGVIAMIVVVAVVISGLILFYLVSCKEAIELYKEQMSVNEELQRANSHLTEAQLVLESEKLKREALLERQLKLISCFDKSVMPENKHGTMERIAEARGHITESKAQMLFHDDIQILELLGEGSFGKVHKGMWRKTLVAIKVMLLPSNLVGAGKRESMVVWEAAISSSLSHPNIVQTYTYSIKPVKENDSCIDDGTDLRSLGSAVKFFKEFCGDSTLNGKSKPCLGQSLLDSGSMHRSNIHGFEVQLVLEFCDKGTLREALDQGVFMGPSGLNYLAILDSAVDIARAMLHLHCNNVLHMDLKARNVLLASSGTEDRGVSCKVADFGLAVRMGLMETHVSGMHQGTMTHMAPEVLLEGRVSKAADVYAFGITLWELFTGGQAYKGVPKALLGHRVAKEKLRPSLPMLMPREYQVLLTKCWSHWPENRPTFAEVLEELVSMRETLSETTPPLQPIVTPWKASSPSAGKQPLLKLPQLSSKAPSEAKQRLTDALNADAPSTLQEDLDSSCFHSSPPDVGVPDAGGPQPPSAQVACVLLS